MDIILVRHGRPQIERRVSGIADPTLDEYGEWQSERVSRWLVHEPVDAIIASPKRRAQQTLAPLVESSGLEFEVVADLDEIDRNSSVYVPTDLLPTEGGELWDKIVAGQWDEIGYDQPEVFQARVRGAWDELVENPRGECVVVGCHGGTIRAILSAISGEDRPSFRVSVDYASITRVRVGEHGPAIRSINETGHFDADRIAMRGPMNSASTVKP